MPPAAYILHLHTMYHSAQPNLPTIQDRTILSTRLVSEAHRVEEVAPNRAEIGETVHLSEGTMRDITSPLFAKLSVADRTQSVVARFGMG